MEIILLILVLGLCFLLFLFFAHKENQKRTQKQRIDVIDKAVTHFIEDFDIRCNSDQKAAIINDVDCFIQIRTPQAEKGPLSKWYDQRAYCLVKNEEDFFLHLSAITAYHALGFKQFIYELQKQNNLEVGCSHLMKRDIFSFMAQKIQMDKTLLFDYTNLDLCNDVLEIIKPKVHIDYKQAPPIKKEAPPRTTERDVLDTIQHFKEFYKKFGLNASDREIACIMGQFAMAQSEEDQLRAMYAPIPTDIPPVEIFKKNIKHFASEVIATIRNSKIKENVEAYCSSNIDSLSEEDVEIEFNDQAQASPPETRQYFRFNYELCAYVLVLLGCDEMLKQEPESIEIKQCMDQILKHATELGYSLV